MNSSPMSPGSSGKQGLDTKKKLGIVLGLLFPLVAGAVLFLTFPDASNQGYAPEQPIPYSHKLHAGTLKIDCKYCHSDVEKSRHAGVPPLGVCMNCHSVVKTESPYVQKMKKHFDEGKPIEWVRIHELPDFTYFPHKRHVAKGLACQTCHGPIQEMERVYQFAPLTMGWCMDCHRGVTTPKNVATRIRSEAKDPRDALPPGHVAAVNCTTCHN